MKEIDFIHQDYDVFRMFNERWALVTAGTIEDYNTRTIGWGSLGTLWRRPVCTVYVTPARYTWNFLEKNDFFTVSFFPAGFHDDLMYLGSHSGRDGDKVARTSLTPVALPEGVTFQEAELTLVCHKLYSDPFDGARAPEDLRNGLYKQVAPHHFYIGEVLRALGTD